MTTISGDTGIDKVQAGTPITASSIMGALNASGTAPMYACRAWVNFNGTGTVAIRASGNVSSITDNGVGDYTVNFTTAMPDVNYSVSESANSSGHRLGDDSRPRTVSNFSIFTYNSTNLSSADVSYINAQVFR